MTDKTVTHEIKLDKSLKTILWALVVGLMLNAIPPLTIVTNVNSASRAFPAFFNIDFIKLLLLTSKFPDNYH